jgi:hypothetical protein
MLILTGRWMKSGSELHEKDSHAIPSHLSLPVRPVVVGNDTGDTISASSAVQKLSPRDGDRDLAPKLGASYR